MNKLLTPAQAFEHIKDLWPDTVRIIQWRGTNLKVKVLPSGIILNLLIDWGNTTEFPLPKKWRDATIHDIVYPFKEAIFADAESRDLNEWTPTYELMGILGSSNKSGFRWMDTDGDTWAYCKVLDDTTDDDSQPISTYPGGTVLLLMGGHWKKGCESTSCRLFLSDKQSIDWDKNNQPTRWKPLPDDWEEEEIDEYDD